MTAADWVWGGLLAAGAGFEVWALRNGRSGDTLSERTRSWFRVSSPVGRTVFAAAWTVFAAWFLVHIVG